LAAGIAHEINTPTQFVGDNLIFLGTAFEDLLNIQNKLDKFIEVLKTGEVGKDAIEAIQEVLKEVDTEYLKDEIPKAIKDSLEGVSRVSEIVKAMKDFSHPGVMEMKLCDINKAINNTITVARNEWKYVAEIETDLDPNLPPVTCMGVNVKCCVWEN
jgi:signal transduction histidine kinase